MPLRHRPGAHQTGGTRPPAHDGVALIVLAAGQGTRVGHETNKVFLPLAGRRVLTWSLDSTRQMDGLGETIVVLQDRDRGHADTVLHRESPGRAVTLVEGGATRHGSELAALRALEPKIRSGQIDVVVIHDAARPLAARTLFAEVIAAARQIGGALPVLEPDGLVFADGSPVLTRLVTVQTPQAFRAGPLLDAYELAARAGFVGSDTAACVERFTRLRVTGVAGAENNIKITFPEDLFLAERLLARAHWRLA